jgi:hypothetical protein
LVDYNNQKAASNQNELLNQSDPNFIALNKNNSAQNPEQNSYQHNNMPQMQIVQDGRPVLNFGENSTIVNFQNYSKMAEFYGTKGDYTAAITYYNKMI